MHRRQDESGVSVIGRNENYESSNVKASVFVDSVENYGKVFLLSGCISQDNGKRSINFILGLEAFSELILAYTQTEK